MRQTNKYPMPAGFLTRLQQAKALGLSENNLYYMAMLRTIRTLYDDQPYRDSQGVKTLETDYGPVRFGIFASDRRNNFRYGFDASERTQASLRAYIDAQKTSGMSVEATAVAGIGEILKGDRWIGGAEDFSVRRELIEAAEAGRLPPIYSADDRDRALKGLPGR